MRIRSKLIVLIAVPLIALTVAAGFGFTSQSVRIETAEDASAAVGESQSAFSAILAVGDERLHRLGAEVGTIEELTEATDAAMAELEASAASTGTTETVNSVRATIDASRSLEPLEAQAALGAAADELLGLDFAPADAYPTAKSRNAAVVNHHAVESLQLREWAWIAYLSTDTVDRAGISILSADFATSKFAISQTRAIDSQGGSSRIQEVLAGPPAVRLAELEVEAIDDLTEGRLTVETPEILGALADFRADWGATVRGQTSALRSAVDDELVAANNLRSLFTLLAALGVVVLLGLIFVIYRSITTPLESLLVRAGSVANEDLPNLVEALRHDDGSVELPEAEVIPVTSGDEIGELVAAFNDVQITAYDLATEQALSRRNVADMFVNLGRRNQQLLQRILAQLTELEQSEEDPDKLRDLFELDNVVTRMRRNAESLLALAGAQTARQWSQPITIDNTVRAAFGEVEGYERIDVAELAETKVIGSVVADVTHLLAELLENAINFSEPTTSVVVNGRSEPDGYIITVVDQGIGMSHRELADGNQRITDPPPLDQVPTRFLGLYVVGRLAQRHGIKVKLTETSSGGIAAKVILPIDLLVTTEDSGPQRSSAEPEVEAETSPLEQDHDLDAELAEMTGSRVAGDGSDEATDKIPDAIQGDTPHDEAARDDALSGDDAVSRHKVADDEVSRHEVAGRVADDGSGDPPDGAPGPGTSGRPVDPVSDGQAPEREINGLPVRTRKSRSATAVAEPEQPESTTTISTGTASSSTESSNAVSTGTESSTTVSTGSNAAEPDDRLADEQAGSDHVDAEAKPEGTGGSSELSELGLPVRQRGGALLQHSTAAERATVTDRAATDSSPEAAGNFSSMMSALTSGVARGLEESDSGDSDRDQSKDGNDK